MTATLAELPGAADEAGIAAPAIGLTGDAIFSTFVAELARDGVSSADVTVVHAVSTGAAYSLCQVCVLIGFLGIPLLAVAMYRSRTVPVAVPAMLAAAFVGTQVFWGRRLPGSRQSRGIR